MGCKNTKDIQNPGTSKGKGAPGSPQKGGKIARGGTPNKSPRKAIKNVDEKALKGTKVADIPQFIKLGKIEMVHGLITHHKLSNRVMTVKVPTEEYIFANGEKTDLGEWNPLLFAVANK